MSGTDSRTHSTQGAADLHEAGGVGSRHHFGTGIQHRAQLVTQHGDAGVGVLDRESSPEATALTSIGQLYQVDPLHRAQQLQRSVSQVQHPQAVAGRMVGDSMGIVGAHIGSAQHVDQELGEFIRSRDDGVERAT